MFYKKRKEISVDQKKRLPSFSSPPKNNENVCKRKFILTRIPYMFVVIVI